MFAIIVGYNPMSHLLAESLISSGHELCIIEKDYKKTEYLWDKFGSMIIHGDGTQKEHLEKGGINRPADIIFALTDDDGANLVVCQAAHDLYNVQQTVAIVNNSNLESLFHVIGVKTIIDKNYSTFQQLENSISETMINHVLPINNGNTNLISITIPSDSQVVLNSTPISGLEMPANCLICLVVRENQTIRPSNNLILQAGDQVIVAGPSNEESRIYNALTGV
tara:strand:- start:48 stop:716 length:669 start_codon:yes stop_codon:yes gene_type:complete